ncbi:glycosyltransferase family 2 protein [Candidatus Woesearchaeota archaeon]|nr:MAG: hypothetical protein QT09_C0003G0013 [archaeon GW2011_AR18]MBS3162176.1 glycosyltransferase family 2 protein [Candidatus Woesearchaeota archaeon]HIH26229.1 glycosyltransferase family 2 protein [Nanoarchaeota archaeon]
MIFPKVLVGGPVSKNHEYSTDKFIKCLKELDYPNFDILLIDNSDSDEFFNKYKDKVNMIRDGSQFSSIKKRMVYCRNLMREKVLKENYDYFFDVDQDVLLPKDALKKLVSDNKEVITGIYYSYFSHNGVEKKLPVLYGYFSKDQQQEILNNVDLIKARNHQFYNTLVKENFNFSGIRRQLTEEEVDNDDLIEIKMCGTGCLLVHRSVLEKLEFRENLDGGFDDVIFCKDIIEKLNLKIYSNNSVKCGHLVRERPWHWARDGIEHKIGEKRN